VAPQFRKNCEDAQLSRRGSFACRYKLIDTNPIKSHGRKPTNQTVDFPMESNKPSQQSDILRDLEAARL